MHSKSRSSAITRTGTLKPFLLWLALTVAALIAHHTADAATDRCGADACDTAKQDERYLRFSTALPPARGATAARLDEMSDQDFSSFSGVGAIVCTVGSTTRSSTAFLAGAFDIAVTVAHTFDLDGLHASNCVYNSIDSLGQIRERIPVNYIKSQWDAEEGASRQIAKDLAVVRLSAPSRYAQRTMPLGKFSGSAAQVVMIGFKTDLDTDTLKRKTRGTVYDRSTRTFAVDTGAFVHDMDSLEIAAGAPVMDERTGVIIGIHTRATDERKNTMITMNEWLESTLRSEIAIETQTARAN